MQQAVDDYLTFVECASRLHCHPVSIRRAVERGDLPAVKLSRRLIRVPASALAALVKMANGAPTKRARRRSRATRRHRMQ